MVAAIAEAARRTGVLWVRPDLPGARPRAVWSLWHDGAAYVVVGGREQQLPGLRLGGRAYGQAGGRAYRQAGGRAYGQAGGRAVVVVRSSRRDRVAEWDAAVEAVLPGTPRWDEVVPLLHARRLNAPDGEAQPARWAAESTVLRLVPVGPR